MLRGPRSVRVTRRYWWGEIEDDGACTPAPADEAAALERLASLETPMDRWVPAGWEDAVACGAVADRAAYLARLHRLASRLAAARVAEAFRGPDIELAQMVRALDGLDEAINLSDRTGGRMVLDPGPGLHAEVLDAPVPEAGPAPRGAGEGATPPPSRRDRGARQRADRARAGRHPRRGPDPPELVRARGRPGGGPAACCRGLARRAGAAAGRRASRCSGRGRPSSRTSARERRRRSTA